MAVQLWLRIVVGGQDHATVVFAPGQSPLIGRDESANDLVLHDPGVSRMHARLACRGDSYFVQDLGSTSGTFVNGQLIARDVELRGGEEIDIGGCILRPIVRPWTHADAGEETLNRVRLK